MVVVADTSPLNCLILIKEIALLEMLYGRIFVPSPYPLSFAIVPPLQVREWIARPPAWLEIKVLSDPVRSLLQRLDRGRREAIELALQLGSNLILIDEARAQKGGPTEFASPWDARHTDSGSTFAGG